MLIDVQVICMGQVAASLYCMLDLLQDYGLLELIDHTNIHTAVHLGAGKHVILLKNLPAYAKV